MIDLESPDQANWQDILPEHEKNVLNEVACFDEKLVVSFMQDASDRVHIYDFQSPA